MRRSTTLRAALTLLLTASALVGCSSGSSSSQRSIKAGHALASQIIHAPSGYAADTTPGSFGAVTADVFSRYGGAASPSSAGFVAGYKGDYVNDSTSEALSITLLEFSSAQRATDYLKSTAPETLSFTAPTEKPYSAVPGAIEISGTKAYNHEYEDGVVMTRGQLYAQMVYFTSAPSPLPIEFASWAATQYGLMHYVATP